MDCKIHFKVLSSMGILGLDYPRYPILKCIRPMSDKAFVRSRPYELRVSSA